MGNGLYNIQPIDTRYNGYLFRSRLEARWAVFFSKAGIEYQYEPEGFSLKIDGKRRTSYLPDFYLPWFKCYVEIKPKGYAKIDEAEDNLHRLFAQHGGCCCMICEGDPVDWNVRVLCNQETHGGGGTDWFRASFYEGATWNCDGYIWGNSKHWICLALEGTYSDEVKEAYPLVDSDWNQLPIHSSEYLDSFRSDFEYAKKEAREARFEHGASASSASSASSAAIVSKRSQLNQTKLNQTKPNRTNVLTGAV